MISIIFPPSELDLRHQLEEECDHTYTIPVQLPQRPLKLTVFPKLYDGIGVEIGGLNSQQR